MGIAGHVAGGVVPGGVAGMFAVVDGASICDDGGGSDDISGVTDGDNMGLAERVTFALGSMTI